MKVVILSAMSNMIFLVVLLGYIAVIEKIYGDYKAFAQLVPAGGRRSTLLFCRFLRSLR